MTSACRVAFVARIDDLMWEISLDLVVSESPPRNRDAIPPGPHWRCAWEASYLGSSAERTAVELTAYGL